MDVKHYRVSPEEDDMRLDRWCKRHLPQITFAYLNKLTRTGQLRVDGARVKTSHRLHEGQEIRIPPLSYETRPADAPKESHKPLTPKEQALFDSMVIYEDRDLYVLNKPSGFAVQGGSKTFHHLDGLLMGLAKRNGERPLLVHRLDRDTSGVIVIAKRRSIAAALGKLFATRAVKKTYWAAVHGIPTPHQGKIDIALRKMAGPKGDRVMPVSKEDEEAQPATTFYTVLDQSKAHNTAWVSLKPVTGRQHQLRAHMAYIETPILGDEKYCADETLPQAVDNKLHLHARRIIFPHPREGIVDITAEMPEHMQKSWALFGFDPQRFDKEKHDEQ